MKQGISLLPAKGLKNSSVRDIWILRETLFQHCYREGAFLGSWQIILFKRRNPEQANSSGSNWPINQGQALPLPQIFLPVHTQFQPLSIWRQAMANLTMNNLKVHSYILSKTSLFDIPGAAPMIATRNNCNFFSENMGNPFGTFCAPHPSLDWGLLQSSWSAVRT